MSKSTSLPVICSIILLGLLIVPAFTNEAFAVSPVLTSIPSYTGYVNNPISFTVSATDSDSSDDDLIFSIRTVAATEGATIDSKTGVFTWTPTAIGTYNIIFSVHDGDLASNNGVGVEFVITDPEVPDDNKPPVITSTIPFEEYAVGDTISYTVTASNPETDQILSYHFNHAPYDGATIDSKTGVFTWTPTAPGIINHKIIVYDGPKNNVKTLTVQITITTNVVGTESPLLVLTGDNPQTMIKGDDYQELGASCTYLGNEAKLDIDTRGLDTTTVGKYNVVYYCDGGNERASETRIIDVVSRPDPTCGLGTELVNGVCQPSELICAITTPTTTIDFGLVKPGYISSSENAKITIDVNQNNKDLIGLETYSSSWTVNGETKLDNKFVEVKDENGEWKSLDTIVRVDTPVTKGSSTTLEYRVNLEGESMTLDSQNLSLNIGVLGICQK